MSYLDWHVGMKVVCLDPGRWEPKLRRGSVYTISAIGEFAGTVYIGTEETPHPRKSELHWKAERFRPIQTRKTDISIFQQMLAPSKIKERADA